MPKTIFGGNHAKLVETLRAARQKSGLTQTELAHRIGRNQAFVSLIERGQRRVDLIEFMNLARAMGEHPQDLFAAALARMGYDDCRN